MFSIFVVMHFYGTLSFGYPSRSHMGLVWISSGSDFSLPFGSHMEIIRASFLRVSQDETVGYPGDGGP